MLYKVTIQYFKCILKRKEKSNAQLNLLYSLCSNLCVCAWACVNACVSMCLCAFRSAMTYREHLQVTLLPNIILFLLALLII